MTKSKSTGVQRSPETQQPVQGLPTGAWASWGAIDLRARKEISLLLNPSAPEKEWGSPRPPASLWQPQDENPALLIP